MKSVPGPRRLLLAGSAALMGGRCISGDFIAPWSHRVAGNAVAMGEHAGVAAALAGKYGIAPHRVDYDDVDQPVQGIRRQHLSALR